jgi:hypothetical protein
MTTRKTETRGSAVASPLKCPHCGVKHRTITPDQCIDRKMSERDLSDKVTGRARYRGWKVAHAGKLWLPGRDGAEGQWLTPMSKGWPDLTLAKEGHRLVFLELKRETEEPDEDQWFWLRLLASTGNRVGVIRPSDLREGRVNAILKQGSPL